MRHVMSIIFRYADYVSFGDEILAIHQKNNEVTPARVINISNLYMQGTQNH